MTDSNTLCLIEEALGYTFQDKQLLLTAFTHSSYAYQHGVESNERLEFLGDAVLQLAVTEMLLLTSKEDEGKLTELRKQYVSKPALEQAEKRVDLMRFLRYSGGENNVGGKTRSNLFEAVIGAIYLDGGLEAAKQFLRTHLSEIASENHKTVLQEYVQEREKTPPVYDTQEVEGGFECIAKALGCSASGFGTSKKAAETEAARKLFKILSEGKRS